MQTCILLCVVRRRIFVFNLFLHCRDNIIPRQSFQLAKSIFPIWLVYWLLLIRAGVLQTDVLHLQLKAWQDLLKVMARIFPAMRNSSDGNLYFGCKIYSLLHYAGKKDLISTLGLFYCSNEVCKCNSSSWDSRLRPQNVLFTLSEKAFIETQFLSLQCFFHKTLSYFTSFTAGNWIAVWYNICWQWHRIDVQRFASLLEQMGLIQPNRSPCMSPCFQ